MSAKVIKKIKTALGDLPLSATNYESGGTIDTALKSKRPIIEKTYTGVVAEEDTYTKAYLYFAKVTPIDKNLDYSLEVVMSAAITSGSMKYTSSCLMEILKPQAYNYSPCYTALTYSNAGVQNSAPISFYTIVQNFASSGNNNEIYLGMALNSSNQPTILPRTISFSILSSSNCTIDFCNTPILQPSGFVPMVSIVAYLSDFSANGLGSAAKKSTTDSISSSYNTYLPSVKAVRSYTLKSALDTLAYQNFSNVSSGAGSFHYLTFENDSKKYAICWGFLRVPSTSTTARFSKSVTLPVTYLTTTPIAVSLNCKDDSNDGYSPEPTINYLSGKVNNGKSLDILGYGHQNAGNVDLTINFITIGPLK